MPARCECLHRRICSRGGWIVGRASSDDALAICSAPSARVPIHPGRGRSHLLSGRQRMDVSRHHGRRSEEHTSELQSLAYLVCRLLLEKKKKNKSKVHRDHTDRVCTSEMT